MRTFGVEEELLLVDGMSGVPLPAGGRLLRQREPEATAPHLVAEVQQEMIEAVSGPQESLGGLRASISVGRARADQAAQAAGARAVALATSPVPVRPHLSDNDRYLWMLQQYASTTRDSLICGFHVHVSVESPEEGVGVLDRIRTWLPVLIALSANSPYWQGEDTGYASYRTTVWREWVPSGPTELFGSLDAYRAYEQQLLDTGVLLDEAMLYFDARLSHHHPTVEVRVADICGTQSAAATVAALVRALVETAAREWRAGHPPPPVPAGVLRLASWKASLRGLTGDLVHPVLGRPRPAGQVVGVLFEHVADALADLGDSDAARRGLREILLHGTGADRQRQVLRKTGRLPDVVREAITATHLPEPMVSA